MKYNFFTKNVLVLLILMILFSFSACQSKELYKESAYYLYTQVELTTYGKLSDHVYNEIWNALADIDNTMSMRLTDSEILNVNKSAGIAPVAVSNETYAIIKKAIAYSNINDVFDISIGSLVSLWGIGSDNAQVPSQSEIDAILPLIDYKKIVLDDDKQTVYLKDKNMKIDLGAIAKGYAADLTKEILLKHKVDQAIINYGGNILTIGEKIGNEPWNIGVQNPDETRGSYLGVLPLVDQSIVTSGTYERFLEVNGKRYHHILSTKDGYPIENDVWSISVVTPHSIDGDALSTLLFAMGIQDAMHLVESMKEVECIMISKDRHVYISSGLKESFNLIDDSFKIAENGE